MNQRRAGPIIAAVVAIPLLLFGAYHAMLEREFYLSPVDSRTQWHPEYRTDSVIVWVALRPAHQLDRLIRPGYWGEE